MQEVFLSKTSDNEIRIITTFLDALDVARLQAVSQQTAIRFASQVVSIELPESFFIRNALHSLLNRMPALKSLDLFLCEEISDKTLTLLSEKSPGLQQLDLNCVKITCNGLRALSSLTALRGLRLEFSTDADLLALSSSTALEKLHLSDLSGNDITDNGLRNLSGLTKLQHLKFHGIWYHA